MKNFKNKNRLAVRNLIDIYNNKTTSDGQGFRIINGDGSKNWGLNEMSPEILKYVRHVFGTESSALPRRINTINNVDWVETTFSGAFNQTEKVNLFSISGIQGVENQPTHFIEITLSNNSDFSNPTYQETLNVDLTNFSFENTFLLSTPYLAFQNPNSILSSGLYLLYFPVVDAQYYKITIKQLINKNTKGVDIGNIYLGQYWQGDSYLGQPEISFDSPNISGTNLRSPFSQIFTLNIPVQFNFLSGSSMLDFLNILKNKSSNLYFLDAFLSEQSLKAKRMRVFGKPSSNISITNNNPLTNSVQFTLQEVRGI